MKCFDVSQDIDLSYMYSRLINYISQSDKQKSIAHNEAGKPEPIKTGVKKNNA